jgi:hypothetical protein
MVWCGLGLCDAGVVWSPVVWCGVYSLESSGFKGSFVFVLPGGSGCVVLFFNTNNTTLTKGYHLGSPGVSWGLLGPPGASWGLLWGVLGPLGPSGVSRGLLVYPGAFWALGSSVVSWGLL